jgi:hypothetical protein
MSRRQIIVLECDRCGRTEEQPPGATTPQEANMAPLLSIKSAMKDHPIHKDYQDLCSTCTRSVAALLGKIFLDKKEEPEG